MRQPRQRSQRRNKVVETPLPQPVWEGRVTIGFIFQDCLQVGLLANPVEFITQLERAAVGARLRTEIVTNQILRDGEVRMEAYLLGYPFIIATSFAERARLEILVHFNRQEDTDKLVEGFLELCDRIFQAQGGIIRVPEEIYWDRGL